MFSVGTISWALLLAGLTLLDWVGLFAREVFEDGLLDFRSEFIPAKDIGLVDANGVPEKLNTLYTSNPKKLSHQFGLFGWLSIGTIESQFLKSCYLFRNMKVSTVWSVSSYGLLFENKSKLVVPVGVVNLKISADGYEQDA